MPIGPKRMPFLEHIDELRRRLFVIIAVLAVGTVVLYFFSKPLYDFILAPVSFLLKGEPAWSFRVLEPMTIRFKIGLWGSAIIFSPVIIWQVMAFFLPALKAKERKWVMPTFLAMVALFLAGAAFCYEIVLPASFAWLVAQAGSMIVWKAVAADLLGIVMYFLLGFGIAFQTPVVVFYLVYFGIVPYKKLRQNWRIVWVVCVLVAAMATPDWSPVSMGALSIAMIVLFETTMFLLRIVLSKRIKAQQLEWGTE